MLRFDQQHYATNPVDWIEDVLDARLWHKQVDVINSVWEHDLTCVKSGHGVGKSFTAASIVKAYLYNHQPPCVVITTAPTLRQVKNILWAEINSFHLKVQEKFDLVGEMLQLEERMPHPRHYAMGMSTDNPDAFQGLHAEHMLVIFDEACGIALEIFEAAESLMSAAGNKTLLIGNPTEPNTYFHHCFTGRIPGYNKLTISSTECPNVRERGDGLYEDVMPVPYPGLVSARWINQKILTYGRHSNYCKARVFGEFPTTSSDQLIDGKHMAIAIIKGQQIRGLLQRLEEAKEVLRSDEIARIRGY